MSVRITGGRLGGRTVSVPDLPGLRPTSARIREALFSMLGQDLSGRSALDAFGGSGVLAFEALSRGAGPVEVVERSRRAARALEKEASRLGADIALHVGDARRVLGSGTWDLVLMDPPYADDPVEWLQVAAPRVRWRLCLEFRAGASLPREVADLEQIRLRRYGDSALAVYGARTTSSVPEGEVVP